MIVMLLTEHHLEFLSLTRFCRGSSESTLVKMSYCWKSHAKAQLYLRPLITFGSCDLVVGLLFVVAPSVCAILYFVLVV